MTQRDTLLPSQTPLRWPLSMCAFRIQLYFIVVVACWFYPQHSVKMIRWNTGEFTIQCGQLSALYVADIRKSRDSKIFSR